MLVEGQEAVATHPPTHPPTHPLTLTPTFFFSTQTRGTHTHTLTTRQEDRQTVVFTDTHQYHSLTHARPVTPSYSSTTPLSHTHAHAHTHTRTHALSHSHLRTLRTYVRGTDTSPWPFSNTLNSSFLRLLLKNYFFYFYFYSLIKCTLKSL